MDPLFTIALALLAMAAVVLGFRRFIRAPKGLSERDPPGVRTVAVFSGDDPEFFQDDAPEDQFVGRRLFAMLCDALAARGVAVENVRKVPFAHTAECVLAGQRFALVFERTEAQWVAGVEWVPDSAAVRRHIALTHRVYSPPDSSQLRQLLQTLDGWLKSQPRLREVRWHRKEKWLFEDTSDPAEVPVRDAGLRPGER